MPWDDAMERDSRSGWEGKGALEELMGSDSGHHRDHRRLEIGGGAGCGTIATSRPGSRWLSAPQEHPNADDRPWRNHSTAVGADGRRGEWHRRVIPRLPAPHRAVRRVLGGV